MTRRVEIEMEQRPVDVCTQGMVFKAVDAKGKFPEKSAGLFVSKQTTSWPVGARDFVTNGYFAEFL
jgi:hypothetical protein